MARRPCDPYSMVLVSDAAPFAKNKETRLADIGDHKHGDFCAAIHS
jgi:hypothetical protein